MIKNCGRKDRNQHNKDKDGVPVKNKELISNNEETSKKEKKAKIIKPFDKRNKSLKIISVSSAILFIAIVVIFNLVFESLFGNLLKWDWSQTNLFSVGDVTTQLLGKLDKDITIVGLYEKGTVSNYTDVEILLDEYVKQSNGRVTVQYIDPVQTPSIKTELDPDNLLALEQKEFVVYCKEYKKARVVSESDIFKTELNETTYAMEITGVTAEQAFSGAIVYATSAETPIVYMTKGQGEAAYATDYTTMLGVLKDNNYLVKDLDLLTATAIPDDARLLVMLAPTKDINEKTKNLLDAFLRKGNSLMVLAPFSNVSYPVLNSLLTDYNIEISNNRVREGDKERRYNDDAYYFLIDAPSSVITTAAVNKSTLVNNVRAINELKNKNDSLTMSYILQTGDKALIETNGDPDKTSPAAISNVGLACANAGYIDTVKVTQSAKVMVIGATEYIADPILKSLGSQVYNIYSFYNSVQWLMNAKGNELLITAKELPSYLLTTGTNTTYWIATVVCIILIPIGLLIMALIVYRKRKNL